jgi:hypothetical protein
LFSRFFFYFLFFSPLRIYLLALDLSHNNNNNYYYLLYPIVVIFDTEAGLFSNESGEPSESLLISPTNMKSDITVPIRPSRNIPTTLSIQVHASPNQGVQGGSGSSSGSSSSSGISGISQNNLRVFDLELKLPKFATLCLTTFEDVKENLKPRSCIKFLLPNDILREDHQPTASSGGGGGHHVSTLVALCEWMENSFITSQQGGGGVDAKLHGYRKPPVKPGLGGSGRLRSVFENVSPYEATESNNNNNSGGGGMKHFDKFPLIIEAEHVDNDVNDAMNGGGVSSSVRSGAQMVSVVIKCNSFELGSILMADLCSFLELKEVSSTCDFLEDMEVLKDLIDQVSELNKSRLKLTVDAAEHVNKVKGLIIKAEDSRLMGDISLLKRHYINLYGLNSEMAME